MNASLVGAVLRRDFAPRVFHRGVKPLLPQIQTHGVNTTTVPTGNSV